MEEIIKIEKDEKGNYWVSSPDDMTGHEVIGILHMMIKRFEMAIITEERNKANEPLV